MSRIKDIVKRVRLIVADPDKSRWSNEEILLILNEAVVDFILNTGINTIRKGVPIINGVPEYEIEESSMFITRVLFEDKTLPLVTYSTMDSLSGTWRQEEGSPKKIVWDKENTNKFRLYPIPKDMEDFPTEQNSLYGALIDIDYSLVTSLLDLSDIEKTYKNYLEIFTVIAPDRLTYDSFNRDIPYKAIYDTAIVYYIAYTLLSYNQDSISPQLAGTYYNKYISFITSIRTKENQNSSMLDFVTNYRKL